MAKKMSISAIDTFAECPRLYKHQYIDRRFRFSNQHFIFGTFGHKLIENILDGMKDKDIHNYVREEAKKGKMAEALKALKVTDIHKLAATYIEDIRTFIKDYTVVSIEVYVEDDDNRGVIDAILIDKTNNELIICDWKFTNYFKGVVEIEDNLQLFMYGKLLTKVPNINEILEQYSIKKISLAYFSLTKVVAPEPKLLKSGKLSKAFDKNMTYDSFMKAITDNDLKVEDYEPHLNELRGNKPNTFLFTKRLLTNNMLVDKVKEIENWNKNINFAIDNNSFPIRNAWACKNCDIEKFCKNYE